MNDFEVLKTLVESQSWDQIHQYSFKDNTCSRLANAIKQINTPDSPGPMDLCGLIHNYLKKASLDYNHDFKIKLNGDFSLLGLQNNTFSEYGLFQIFEENQSHYLSIRPKLKCDWINDLKEFRGFYEASLQETNANDFFINFDNSKPKSDYPVEYFTGYETNINESQKLAVRNLFQLEPGGIILISLPTGAGKSLLFHLSALTNLSAGNMTIVVVPTVSLAQDHERSFTDLLKVKFPDEFNEIKFAYTGNLMDGEKNEFKYRIKNGLQPILFVSPESLLGSLLPSINIAARKGFIRYFFIDEAHIISEWGNNFRPDFQFLPSLIQSLNNLQNEKTSSFRTILLSATVTSATRSTLNNLFTENAIPYVNASDLRKEIVFWKQKFQSYEEKKKALFDLIKFLPRPILIYETKRPDVESLLLELKRHGYHRTASYHGGTDSNSRSQILKKWHDNQLDILVANTAFGLGVSKGNVRSVIHFCVPESLDRLYQEVGRSGRDGKIAISFMLFTEDDIEQAKFFNTPKYLTREMALNRWLAMTAGIQLSNQKFKEIDLRRYHLGLNSATDLNETWNKRMLVLMVRAGLIEIELKMPDAKLQSELTDINLGFPDYLSKIFIRLTGSDFFDNTSQIRFKAEMDKDIANAENQFETMIKVLKNELHYGEAFGAIYGVDQSYWCCLSCPKCRKNNRLQRNNMSQIKPFSVNHNNDDPVFHYFYYRTPIDTSQKNFRNILKTLDYLIQKYDIKELFITQDDFNYKRILDILLKSTPLFIITRYRNEIDDSLYDNYCNRISFIKNQDEFDKVRYIERPKHIIIFPNDVRDIQNHNNYFINVHGVNCSIHEISRALP